MLRRESSFKCASCDICQLEKSASLMCTLIVKEMDSNTVEEVCWCVCQDCLPLIEDISGYYEGIINQPTHFIPLPTENASEKH